MVALYVPEGAPTQPGYRGAGAPIAALAIACGAAGYDESLGQPSDHRVGGGSGGGSNGIFVVALRRSDTLGFVACRRGGAAARALW